MTTPGELVTPTGVLVMAAEQMNSDRDAWLEARRWRKPDAASLGGAKLADLDHQTLRTYGYRIGSSDVPSILDLDGVGTPVHVYRNKVDGVQVPVTERMEWGHLFEGVIAAEWTRRNRCVTDEIGLIALASKPWHQSTIDRRVRECPISKDLTDGCGLEIKNVGYSSYERFAHRELPDRIFAQLVHQRAVTGYDHMHYAMNIGGNRMVQGAVHGSDPKVQEIEAYIFHVVDDIFRAKHLLTGVEPPWSDSKAAKLIELDNATYGRRVGELDVHDVGFVMEYAQVLADMAPLRKRQEQIKAEMRRVAAGAEVVTFGGERAYWYTPTSRANVDVERLKERWPAAFADVVSESSSPTLHIDKNYKIKEQA